MRDYVDDAPKAMRQPGPDEALRSELGKRCEEAEGRAIELERQAREWRAVEHACQRALDGLDEDTE